MQTQSDWYSELAVNVWAQDAAAVQALVNGVDPQTFNRVIELLSGIPGKIVSTGTGTSGVAAKKIAHTLSCVNRPAFFLSPADAVHGALGAVQSGDVAIVDLSP